GELVGQIAGLGHRLAHLLLDFRRYQLWLVEGARHADGRHTCQLGHIDQGGGFFGGFDFLCLLCVACTFGGVTHDLARWLSWRLGVFLADHSPSCLPGAKQIVMLNHWLSSTKSAPARISAAAEARSNQSR